MIALRVQLEAEHEKPSLSLGLVNNTKQYGQKAHNFTLVMHVNYDGIIDESVDSVPDPRLLLDQGHRPNALSIPVNVRKDSFDLHYQKDQRTDDGGKAFEMKTKERDNQKGRCITRIIVRRLKQRRRINIQKRWKKIICAACEQVLL